MVPKGVKVFALLNQVFQDRMMAKPFHELEMTQSVGDEAIGHCKDNNIMLQRFIEIQYSVKPTAPRFSSITEIMYNFTLFRTPLSF